jgi:endoribonuclease Dicer
MHLQRGMGKNYERLEFLGDSFLKMTTTIMVFIRHPKSDELEFHVKRMEMLCNLNLFNVALGPEIDLPQFIRSQGFNRRTWYPEGMVLLNGKGAAQAKMSPVQHGIPKQPLAQKTIADVSEALIGASLLSGRGPDDFDMAIRAVTKLVESPEHDIDSWADYARLYNPPPWSIDTRPNGFTRGDDSAQARIEKRIGYKFRHPQLLRSAMTHPSCTSSRVPDYQSLEFLGDAILDMVSIRSLYDRYPDRDPHWLTEHKMAMVSNQFLAAVAVDLELDKHLLRNGLHVHRQINEYAVRVRDRLPQAKANNQIDFWTDLEDAPKCLSDAVESYIGAVFVDSGFSYRRVDDFFSAHIFWYFSDMAVYDTYASSHPATRLQTMPSWAPASSSTIASSPPPRPSAGEVPGQKRASRPCAGWRECRNVPSSGTSSVPAMMVMAMTMTMTRTMMMSVMSAITTTATLMPKNANVHVQ